MKCSAELDMEWEVCHYRPKCCCGTQHFEYQVIHVACMHVHTDMDNEQFFSLAHTKCKVVETIVKRIVNSDCYYIVHVRWKLRWQLCVLCAPVLRTSARQLQFSKMFRQIPQTGFKDKVGNNWLHIRIWLWAKQSLIRDRPPNGWNLARVQFKVIYTVKTWDAWVKNTF